MIPASDATFTVGNANLADEPEKQPHLKASTKKLWLFYHFLYPDPVVSAVHMHQLCLGLTTRGWAVTEIAGNRGCRDEDTAYPHYSKIDGISIRRIWRPRLRQSSTPGRLLNAAWMIGAWSLLAFRHDLPDAVIVGTDPILSVTAAIFWKFVNPEIPILHWCFDLYPEAAFADGVLSPNGRLARSLTFLLKRAYAACDAIVDIGPCMRKRLAPYVPPFLDVADSPSQATIVPWALLEPSGVLPSSIDERKAIAGARRLVLLYSGSFGRAHTSTSILDLARSLHGEDAAIVFSVQGNCEPQLRANIAELPPGSTCDVLQVPFAAPGNVLDRLTAPDIHLVSLADHWTGLVVPSKCFGALAVGRPLLFSGSRQSSIALWIEEYQLGWVLDGSNADAVARDLLDYIDKPSRVRDMQQRCFDTYQQHFSRHSGIDHMDAILQDLTSPERTGRTSSPAKPLHRQPA